MDTPPKLITLLVDRLDLLKHFAKEKPWWKLAALFLIKMPATAGAICLAFWHTHR